MSVSAQSEVVYSTDQTKISQMMLLKDYFPVVLVHLLFVESILQSTAIVVCREKFVGIKKHDSYKSYKGYCS